MSRTQFHGIKLFILRHTWLNLWDKHMTTGRINQVSIVHSPALAIAGENRRGIFRRKHSNTGSSCEFTVSSAFFLFFGCFTNGIPEIQRSVSSSSDNRFDHNSSYNKITSSHGLLFLTSEGNSCFLSVLTHPGRPISNCDTHFDQRDSEKS